jgi:hypothetical protein
MLLESCPRPDKTFVGSHRRMSPKRPAAGRVAFAMSREGRHLFPGRVWTSRKRPVNSPTAFPDIPTGAAIPSGRIWDIPAGAKLPGSPSWGIKAGAKPEAFRRYTREKAPFYARPEGYSTRVGGSPRRTGSAGVFPVRKTGLDPCPFPRWLSSLGDSRRCPRALKRWANIKSDEPFGYGQDGFRCLREHPGIRPFSEK